MAFNVVYDPAMTGLAQASASSSGGITRAEQQRFYDNLREQQRQFDLSLMQRADITGLGDLRQQQQMAQDAGQFNAQMQFNTQRANFDALMTQQQMAEQAHFRQAQLDQEKEANSQQTMRALAGEFGASARQRQSQDFENFQAQVKAGVDSWRKGEIDQSQFDQWRQRLEEKYGWPVDLPQRIATQQTQSQAIEEYDKNFWTIASAFKGLDTDEYGGLPEPDAFMSVNPRTGEAYFDSALMFKEVQSRRDYARMMKVESMRSQEDQAAKAQTESLKQIKVRQEAERAYQRYANDLAQYASDVTEFDGEGKAPQKPSIYSYSGIPVIGSPEERDMLPVGTPYVAPDGSIHTRK